MYNLSYVFSNSSIEYNFAFMMIFTIDACTIFSLSLTASRKIHHLVAKSIGMKKLAMVDEYLNYLGKTLEQTAKPRSTLFGVFLEM